MSHAAAGAHGTRPGMGGWVAIVRRFAPLSPAVWPALLYLTGFYMIPLLLLLRLGLWSHGPSWGPYARILQFSYYARALGNTFTTAAVVAALCLLLGYPAAYVVVQAPRKRATVLLAFVMIPFFTGLLVRNYAWYFLLGAHGVINTALLDAKLIHAPMSLMFNRFAVIVGMVHIQLPYMILVLIGVMRGIQSRHLMRAASSLGAEPFNAFRRVFLPLSRPAIWAGLILVFVTSLAFYVTPAMLGSPRDSMMANMIAAEVNELHWDVAAALATMLLLATLAALTMAHRTTGWSGFGRADLRLVLPRRRAALAHDHAVLQAVDVLLNPIWAFVPAITAGFVFAFLVLPVLVVIPLSFNPEPFFVFPPSGFSWRWYQSFFDNPAWLSAAWHSLEIGCFATLLALALGVPAAFGLARRPHRWSGLAYALILSPLLVPSIITAIAVFFVFSALGLTNTVWGVVLGHAIAGISLVVIVVSAALKGFDWNLERAALSLGASRPTMFRRIVLPMLGAAIGTAAFFAFLHSFDELLIALFVSGIAARTLPKMMWDSLLEINPTISAVSTLLIAVTMLMLIGVTLLRRNADRHRLVPEDNGET